MEVPDYSDPRPVKVQIADNLRDRVASGAYAPGDKLPPVRELAMEYHVVTGTVRDAIDVLRREGILQTRSTRGTYVLKTPSEQPPSEYAIVIGRIDELAEEVRRLRGEVTELRQARAT
jgi:DNA-binding GntR family transcriptional regulator